MMKELRLLTHTTRPALLYFTPLAVILLLAMPAGSAQAPKHGDVAPLGTVKFEADDDVKCLTSALENGDPNTGASTFILKAPPGCVVPKHYHTAEEQLIVVRGTVSTGMQGIKPLDLGPGGFAMMPSKEVHWFTCAAKQECLMFVTFDRKYDITWVKEK